MTKTEAAHEVRQVLQLVRDFTAQPSINLSEADTRAHFIDPLLHALGYHEIGAIRHEVPIPATNERLDYLLVRDQQPMVAVEAKAISVALADAHAAQVVEYCSVIGVEWAVVTNGRQWRLYHAFANGDLAAKHVLSVDLVGWTTDSQFDSVFEALWLISRDSFAGGAGPGTWLASKKLDRVLRGALTDPASPEVKYLRQRLQVAGIPATTEQVAAWFKGRLDVSLVHTPPTEAPVASMGPVSGPMPQTGPTTPAGVAWPRDLIERAYRESPDTMKKVFGHLAIHPGERVPVTDVAKVVGYTRKQLAGALGAFGVRVKHRYGQPTWPFTAEWDATAHIWVYTMQPTEAAVVRSLEE
jgi:hypothetical protein